MSLTPADRDETPRIEVRIYEDEVLVHTALFDSLSAAEAFAEEWGEQVPGARAEFEDLAHTHTLYEVVESDTAVFEEYERDVADETQE